MRRHASHSRSELAQLRAEVAAVGRSVAELREHVHTLLDSRHTSDVRALASSFTEHVSSLRQTRVVLLDTSGEISQIWTVIKAKPFHRAARELIYDAELEALDAFPGTPVEFRLVNEVEYDHGTLSDVLPTDAEVVWKR